MRSHRKVSDSLSGVFYEALGGESQGIKALYFAWRIMPFSVLFLRIISMLKRLNLVAFGSNPFNY
ncbi:hypothetical protein NTGM5_630005 [Candidatus Nitrotoga sp. M5]|nr:hypothetical protein NTGM5_630005 [Candidatus Nitrotoga sp. M5]